MPSVALAEKLQKQLKHVPTSVERQQLYLKELGDIKVLKNDFAQR